MVDSNIVVPNVHDNMGDLCMVESVILCDNSVVYCVRMLKKGILA